jgi:high affinity Mn2+ porin
LRGASSISRAGSPLSQRRNHREEADLTDINQSLSAGFSLAGARWVRPDDTVGLAGVVNRISHDGKPYLEAGGLGGSSATAH